MKHIWATAQKVLSYKWTQLRMRTVLGDPARSRILMFHDVCRNGDAPGDEYACCLSRLTGTIDRYREAGFRFLSLDALLSMPSKEAACGCCILTFDDGFASIASSVLPVLAELNVPFTVYVTAGWLGTEGYLSVEQLRSVSAHPLCTVGSHSVTHPMFRFLNRVDAMAELTQSKARLETVTGKPVRHFAFPYGSAYACARRDSRLAAQAGYASAARTTAAVLTAADLNRPFALPRLDRG